MLIWEKKKKTKKTPAVIIHKVIWPEESVTYEKCEHGKNIIIDRDLLNTRNHINLLATPRKTPVQNQGPILVQKHLLPATVRINKLAQPNKNLLLQNFKDHHHHLKIFQIENFLKHFYDLHYETPKQAVRRMRQEIRDEKMREKYLNSEVKQMKDKIYQEKLKVAEKLVATALGKLKNELLKKKEVQLSDEQEEMSDIILISLCRLMGGILNYFILIKFISNLKFIFRPNPSKPGVNQHCGQIFLHLGRSLGSLHGRSNEKSRF